MTMKPGIPTHYNGINFRSRLEAKWARMFDLLCWKWEYEPFDLNGYIPDFLIQAETPILVEVKPAANPTQLKEMCQKAISVVGKELDYKFLGVGCVIPLNASFLANTVQIGIATHEYGTMGESDEDEKNNNWMIDAEFIYCDQCNRYSYFLYEGAWQCELCHKHSKEHFNKVYNSWNVVRTEEIKGFWAEATNITQYDRVFLANHKRSSRLIQKKPLPPLPKLKESPSDDDFFSPENIKLAQEWAKNRQV